MVKRVGIILIVLLSFAPASLLAQQNTSLATVQKIYVGPMGQSDEAARFRLLLAEELQKQHFDVVSDAGMADAELTGVLTVRVYADTSLARATVSLKTADGRDIWGRDFEPRHTFGGRNDTVKLRAQDVAKSLRNDVKKAEKKAGKSS
jgi:hypothetical protein